MSSGGCDFYPSCTSTGGTAVSAGTLTISGGTLAAPVMVAPSADTYSYTASTLFSAGQTLVVSASGATVPSFGPDSVVAPGLPVLTAPAASAGAYTIATTADLTVTWTGGESGDLFFIEGVDTSNAYFVCEWDASLGSGTVPQAVLAGLAGQSNAFLAYAQFATTTFTVGGYSISESALPYSGGTATFQ